MCPYSALAGSVLFYIAQINEAQQNDVRIVPSLAAWLSINIKYFSGIKELFIRSDDQ